MKLKIIQILLGIYISGVAFALEIKGTIDLQDDWQPVVYLASLNSPENLFVASPDFIIAETFILPDGSFSIATQSIPADARFYRLYLVKGNNSTVEFNPTDHRNFIHLLLDKNSIIEIDAKVENNTLAVNQLLGTEDNLRILEFDKELVKRKEQITTDITSTKREYLTQDLENYIRDFVESENNTLVALYALYHIEEKDTDFLKNSDFYFDFEKRLNDQNPTSIYTQSYAELLEELIGFRDMVCEMPGVQPKWKDNLLIVQAIVIAILLVIVFMLYRKMAAISKTPAEEMPGAKTAYSNLTVKEQEILKLMASGKTNKEIAQELFVELSTVKTHINSIYKQLKLSNRKEAVEFFNELNL